MEVERMECRELSPLLSAYVDGELDPFQKEQLENHCAGCMPCTEKLARLRKLSGVLGAWEYHPAEITDAEMSAIRDGIRMRSTNRTAGIVARVLQPAVFAIVIFIGIIAGTSLGHAVNRSIIPKSDTVSGILQDPYGGSIAGIFSGNTGGIQ
jgi:anti-sigma factor RsiW